MEPLAALESALLSDSQGTIFRSVAQFCMRDELRAEFRADGEEYSHRASAIHREFLAQLDDAVGQAGNVAWRQEVTGLAIEYYFTRAINVVADGWNAPDQRLGQSAGQPLARAGVNQCIGGC